MKHHTFAEGQSYSIAGFGSDSYRITVIKRTDKTLTYRVGNEPETKRTKPSTLTEYSGSSSEFITIKYGPFNKPMNVWANHLIKEPTP